MVSTPTVGLRGFGLGESVCRRGFVPGSVAGARSVTIHLCGLPGDTDTNAGSGLPISPS